MGLRGPVVRVGLNELFTLPHFQALENSSFHVLLNTEWSPRLILSFVGQTFCCKLAYFIFYPDHVFLTGLILIDDKTKNKNSFNLTIKRKAFFPPHPSSQDGAVCVSRSIWFPEPLGSLWLRWDVLQSAICWDASTGQTDFSGLVFLWCLAGTHCWWPWSSPLWPVVRSLHSTCSRTRRLGPLVFSEWGEWRGNGEEAAFSAGHFDMMKEGSATFSGSFQVEGSIDFQCSRIQTDLLIFNSPLPVSRSHVMVTGCRSEAVLSPFLTYFSFSDSPQHWDICSFSCRGNSPRVLICALLHNLCSTIAAPGSEL